MEIHWQSGKSEQHEGMIMIYFCSARIPDKEFRDLSDIYGKRFLISYSKSI